MMSQLVKLFAILTSFNPINGRDYMITKELDSPYTLDGKKIIYHFFISKEYFLFSSNTSVVFTSLIPSLLATLRIFLMQPS